MYERRTDIDGHIAVQSATTHVTVMAFGALITVSCATFCGIDNGTTVRWLHLQGGRLRFGAAFSGATLPAWVY